MHINIHCIENSININLVIYRCINRFKLHHIRFSGNGTIKGRRCMFIYLIRTRVFPHIPNINLKFPTYKLAFLLDRHYVIL